MSTEEDRPRVGMFDGTGNYAIWKRQVQALALMQGGTHQEKALIVFKRVTGIATAVLLEDVDLDTGEFPFENARQIFTKLDAHYAGSSQQQQQQAAQDLGRLRMKGGDFEEYASRFTELAVASGLAQNGKIGFFMAGLPLTVKQTMGITEPATMSEAINMARRAHAIAPKPEKRWQSTKGRGGQTQEGNPNITCYGCQKKGHIKRNCPRNGGQGRQAQTEQPTADPEHGGYDYMLSGNE